MTRFDFYDIVRIRQSAATVRSGVGGQVGVVTGFSTPEYIAVTVNEDGYMIAAVDLEFTGERVDPEFFQTGDHIAVRPQYYGPESDSEATE